MGGGGLSAKQIAGTQSEILMLMMPVYYISDAVVTQADLDSVKVGWNMIIKDCTPPYLNMKQDPNFEYNSCISWFYTIFYDRLFDVHPVCRPLFTSGIVGQGKFLVKMVSMTLSQLRDPRRFQQMMEELAVRHCQRGVRGCEYSIVGEVLFYCLLHVEGPTIFTIEVEMSWKKIFSVMLRIIIPLVINYERTGELKNIEDKKSNSSMNLQGTLTFTH
jgi:hemoglobin-like flavoprotein